MPSLPAGDRPSLTPIQWLICTIAAIGFAFDIYELLMMPLIARPALAELLGVDPMTESGFRAILTWNSYIMWGSAICGGTFGLLGGYLTDRFGRRRVLTWSILIYAFSALAAGFSRSPEMLLVLRCTTFIGVCVEFVAAVAWLAELFPDPKRREAVLGYTQAFSSVGGLLVTLAYKAINDYSASLPLLFDDFDPSKQSLVWRYTLISGVVPALPLILIRPFLPESPAWLAKRATGKLKRPSLRELFAMKLRRTTLVTTTLFACGYGAAFGAIQFTPQIVPGLVPGLGELPKLRKQLDTVQPDSPEAQQIRQQIRALGRTQESVVSDVQFWQEIGGLAGRFALAYLALRIVSRRGLLRLFQVPGLLLIPLVFLYPAAGRTPPGVLDALNTDDLMMLKIGIFVAGFLTIAQFSFWGNYLPRVYPIHLRGTGEGFAANVGGRMFGTAANALTGLLFAPLILNQTTGLTPSTVLAFAAAATAFLVYTLGVAASFFLPEPKHEDLPD